MSALTVSHDAHDGTVVLGTQRGDGSRTVLRTYGLRWGAKLGAWYLPNSRARAADQALLDALAAALRGAGFDVDVDVVDVSIADAEDARAQLAVDRAQRLRSRAERLQGRAEDRAATAHQVLDHIPPGQPILVGHHGEGRHRRALARADRAMHDAVEAAAGAQAAQRGAVAAEHAQRQRYTLPSIERRLDGLRADARSLQRRLDGTASPLSGPATGDYLDRLRERADQVSEAIAYWESQREAVIEAEQAHVWTAADFAKGDRVRTVRGLTATVRRVNAKTLTVHYDVMPAAITNPLRYYDVADRLAADDEEQSR